MKLKKYTWLICFLCISFLLVACEKERTLDVHDNDAGMVVPERDEEATVEELIQKEQEKENIKEAESIQVATLSSKWEKQENITFLKTNWKKELPNDIRFVLIDANESITQEKQKIMRTWLEEDKVVLFYGKNVQPEEVKEKIGMEISVFEVKSNASFDFPYLLYGYGFSMTYEQYLPIFLSSNTGENFEEKIATFLLKNKNF